MNGIHDMGGMDGFGPVVREQHEPVFHADWEGRVFALANTIMGRGIANTDEFRHAIERIPPARYLASSYYERWLAALETLLVEHGVATRDDIAALVSSHGAIGGGEPDVTPARPRSLPLRARFKPGDRVRARNVNPHGHTRLPRYARGRRGVIRRDWGVYVFPDTHAHGRGPRLQHVYSVEFDAREVWGKPAGAHERIMIDLWDEYLEAATATSAKNAARKSAPMRRRSAKR
jgi:nitrile hydratase beta subunit